MDISNIKLSELANLTKSQLPSVSRYFKNKKSPNVQKVNNRITGVDSEEAEKYLIHSGLEYFYQPSLIMFSNLCGGVGKTSGINNVSAFIRRITSKYRPIFIIDADSQASLTELVFGEMADDNDLVLVDYIDGKANLEDIITPCEHNIYFIKSNFNLSGADKVLNNAKRAKTAMYNLYMDIFKKYPNAYILQDNAPSLGSIFGSSICGMYMLDESIHKAVMIPIRSDKTAINGADKVLKEISDLKETYSFTKDIPIHCYFASIDKRTTSTFEAIEEAKNKENVLNALAGPYIRYSAEVIKNLNHGTNIYSAGKTNHAAIDYADLVQYVFKGKPNA